MQLSSTRPSLLAQEFSLENLDNKFIQSSNNKKSANEFYNVCTK